MGENNEVLCTQHGACIERQENLVKEVDSLKEELSKVKDELQDTKLQQIRDNERLVTLFNVVNEIKDCIKQINDKIDNKKDTFKDTMFKFAVDLGKYAMIGGLVYYLTSIK